jgi:hypothetical protein
MKSVVRIALALSIFAGSVSAQAQTSTAPTTWGPLKPGSKITKKWQLHDGCHSRYAQMRGKPCH